MQARPDVALARHRWQRWLDLHSFVFFDEMEASTKLTRLYGRALKGRGLPALAPRGQGQTTTFQGCLTCHGLTRPWCSTGR